MLAHCLSKGVFWKVIMPKVFDNFYDQLTGFGNLYLAWNKAAKGKRGNPAAASFEMNLADNLIQLQAELREQCWEPGEYYSFYIRDPKRRLVSAAPFRDRVVHHALHNVTEAMFENTFIGDSYANRKGRGTHAAINKAQRLMQRYPYVLQCDLKQFFPSIDHVILESLLNRKVIDERVRWLFRKIIRSGENIHNKEYQMVYFPGDDLFAASRKRGLPIGNLTSQFWANVYLNELDQFVKRELRCKAYVRYVDDFLLFAENKQQLWKWKAAIRERLFKLRLVMHEKSSTVYPVKSGVPYLGFRLFPEYRLLKRKNGVNFQRRLCRYYREYQRGEIDKTTLNQRVKGWIAHVENADTWGLRRSIFSVPIPRQK